MIVCCPEYREKLMCYEKHSSDQRLSISASKRGGIRIEDTRRKSLIFCLIYIRSISEKIQNIKIVLKIRSIHSPIQDVSLEPSISQKRTWLIIVYGACHSVQLWQETHRRDKSIVMYNTGGLLASRNLRDHKIRHV